MRVMPAGAAAVTSAVRPECITDVARLRALQSEWASLWERAGSDNPFVHPAWVLPWWDCYGGEHALLAVAVWRDDELVAVAPLMKSAAQHARLPAKLVEFVGMPLSDRAEILCAAAHAAPAAAAVCDALADASVRWDVLVLREVPDFSPTLAAMRETARARGWLRHERVCAVVPVLDVGAGYDAVHAGLGKNIKKQINQKRNRMARRGAVGFQRVLPTPAELPALLDVVFDLERRSWKGREGVGLYAAERDRAFFRRTLADFAALRMVDIATLTLDDAVVAYHLGLRARGRYYSYNLAFDPAFADCSPGTLLMDALVRTSADAHDVRVLDASRSVPEHVHLLSRWSKAAHTHVEITLYPRRCYPRGLHALHARLAPALRQWRGQTRASEGAVSA